MVVVALPVDNPEVDNDDLETAQQFYGGYDNGYDNGYGDQIGFGKSFFLLFKGIN